MTLSVRFIIKMSPPGMRKPTSTKPTLVSSRADCDAAAPGWGMILLKYSSWYGWELRSMIRIDRGRAVRLRSRPGERDMTNSSNFRIETTTAPPEERFWQAMRTRDADYDGLFYYGVYTTGVYCRPSCASRQPKRENILFFALPEAARQEGFRACLRCRPDEAVV